ncbi:MAG: Bifunctional phosphoglucose/phosphomannose isomerase [Candidatus Gottesmanbacteria bacterium GW2011_GWA2_44_17]|uniref:Bifunctional phosphoglucose/phosphomannose isomerase n=3 Tax=Candidatus Gottesmaniibacteriota TaxID=1752720 RepID=A0A0G1IPT5_9BACT|nr:MAG: Bifunctional phosphoglucose/phosphomannose isomerase [Microgenomates group bacterium GW2011_GWC1_43_11]KKT38483.1 MAG: Bifunctional phosphoglucose/phosphomannose isomerase [Candidatus Gottesmanbacteria bacterium GW2011_GWB1_44_11c]KKT47797.1 MAG: Bifunctional phosphoglucose/phosphomannose isomerase [Candidatus Gottesmanbacteria bacterium GW2011_GWA2_44_17]KKT60978.1 MAG: Bifunctional phosphoglucose/phosphomannose isomerase [Candidatus Gottesmanbacteria bacterium GW2011_GWA1_44_24b]HCM82
MNTLDSVDEMKKLDTVSVIGSIEQLGDQCKQAWGDVQSITFPEQYKHVSSLVFSGMGGSALGAYVMKSLFSDTLPIPFEIVNDYHVPIYVNQHTLVVLGSYSGSTEETVSSAREGIAKKACVTGLTIGGALGKLFSDRSIPFYKINPIHNPSNQPRLGTGYSIFGQIALLTKLGFLNVTDNDLTAVIQILSKGNSWYGIENPEKQNKAKQLAKMLYQKIPIIVTAEFLSNVGRVVRNQIHESAKNFADYHIIPELNHHLMEGLTNPDTNKQLLVFVFFCSLLYSPRISTRFRITKDVVEKQKIKTYEFIPTSLEKISQVFECIQFGAYVNYYMAMLYGLDPSKIPWVDYFKTQVGKWK